MPLRKYNVIGDTEPWLIDTKYEIIKRIGKGSYGIVCSAKDTTTGRLVAIKKVINIFDPMRRDDLIPRRIHRELKIMKHFDHPNILRLEDCIPISNPHDYECIYLVTDLLDCDLRCYIDHNRRMGTTIPDDLIQTIMQQILLGLKAIHAANVMHRDLSPKNVLINREGDVKICDLGLARGFDQGEEYEYAYVQARHYRAPETTFLDNHYTKAIDVWSAGCILAEMFLLRPLFNSKSYGEQVRQTLRLIGTPPASYISRLPEMVRNYIKPLPTYAKVPIRTAFPHIGAAAVDLLEKMLAFPPEDRITAEEALRHPFITGETFRDPLAEGGEGSQSQHAMSTQGSSIYDSQEEDAEIPDPPLFDNSFEREHLTREDFRDRICHEVNAFRGEHHMMDNTVIEEEGGEVHIEDEPIEITDFTPAWTRSQSQQQPSQ